MSRLREIFDALFPNRDTEAELDDYATKAVHYEQRGMFLEEQPGTRWDPYALSGRGAWVETDETFRKRVREKYGKRET